MSMQPAPAMPGLLRSWHTAARECVALATTGAPHSVMRPASFGPVHAAPKRVAREVRDGYQMGVPGSFPDMYTSSVTPCRCGVCGDDGIRWCIAVRDIPG